MKCFHTTGTLRVLTAQQDPKAFAQIVYYMYMYVTFHGIAEYVEINKGTIVIHSDTSR